MYMHMCAWQVLIDLQPTDFALHEHHDLELLVSVHVAYERSLSLLVLMAWGRLAKYLRMSKRVGILVAIPPPTSYVLRPTSYVLPPTSYVLRPTSCILHPTSYILHPTSCILRFTGVRGVVVERASRP